MNFGFWIFKMQIAFNQQKKKFKKISPEAIFCIDNLSARYTIQ